MRKTGTTIRCVPRLGYDYTQVRVIDIDLLDAHEMDHRSLRDMLEFWFAERGIDDAVYDLETDRDGLLAIINDEAFLHTWGSELA